MYFWRDYRFDGDLQKSEATIMQSSFYLLTHSYAVGLRSVRVYRQKFD